MMILNDDNSDDHIIIVIIDYKFSRACLALGRDTASKEKVRLMLLHQLYQVIISMIIMMISMFHEQKVWILPDHLHCWVTMMIMTIKMISMFMIIILIYLIINLWMFKVGGYLKPSVSKPNRI